MRLNLLNTVIIILLSFAAVTANAQNTDSLAYNRYLDLNLAVLEGRTDDAEKLIELLEPDTAKLPAGTRVNFYNMAGKFYEDGQSVKAISYFKRVTQAVPNYYVAHRALGFLYLKEVESTRKKMNASAGKNGTREAYAAAVKKALPHLEKAQACDPDPDTLAIIQSLYKNTDDTEGLKSLDKRLAGTAKNCIDILDAR